jgi:hypothetical protein
MTLIERKILAILLTPLIARWSRLLLNAAWALGPDTPIHWLIPQAVSYFEWFMIHDLKFREVSESLPTELATTYELPLNRRFHGNIGPSATPMRGMCIICSPVEMTAGI